MTRRSEEQDRSLRSGATADGWASSEVLAASELAFEVLGPHEPRWRHTRAVVGRAGQAAGVLPAEDVPALLAAAWLHDIGHAPALRSTGFHPLDGAEHLRGRGWSPLIAGLVAQHSAARHVADVLGLTAAMRPYDQPEACAGPLADALTWADQTTSPTGETVDVSVRLHEVLQRHGPDSPIARAHPLRAAEIERAVAATEDALLLRRAGQRLAGS